MNKWIVVLIVVLKSAHTYSQENTLVNYEVSQIGESQPGDTISVCVTLNIMREWYIYAPTEGNRIQNAQIMHLRFPNAPKGMRRLGALKIPETRMNKSFQVFMGDGNTFCQQYIIDNNAVGTCQLTAELEYQACNKNICYPPVTEKIDVTIKVRKPPLPAAQVIKKATQLAKSQNKNVFIIFHSSWCVWCSKMDTALQDTGCNKAFNDHYIIEHLTVFESKQNRNMDNPGAEALLKKYQPSKSGIPFFIILDGNGKLVGDSMISAAGSSPNPVRKNMGCPTSPAEIEAFVHVLGKTSSMSIEDLSAIARVFGAIK